jgi:hypothetical protein
MGRKALDGRLRQPRPLLLVPPAPDDPLTGSCAGHGVRHHLNDLIPAGGGQEIENEPGLADAGEMPVSLDETGHRELSAQLQDLCRRGEVAGNVRVRSDREDPAVADGERLCLRPLLVESDDAAAAKHQFCGLPQWTGPAAAQAERNARTGGKRAAHDALSYRTRAARAIHGPNASTNGVRSTG